MRKGLDGGGVMVGGELVAAQSEMELAEIGVGGAVAGFQPQGVFIAGGGVFESALSG